MSTTQQTTGRRGKQNPQTGWETATDSIKWNVLSKGFHMDSGATVVTISNTSMSSGQTAFECGVAEFRVDPETQENPYYFIYARKYTVCFAGGFDGWDVYREQRTNSDDYKIGRTGFVRSGFDTFVSVEYSDKSETVMSETNQVS